MTRTANAEDREAIENFGWVKGELHNSWAESKKPATNDGANPMHDVIINEQIKEQK